MKIISTKPGDTNFQLVELIPKSLYAPDSIRHRQAESINMEFLDNFYVLLDNNEPQASLAIYNNPQLNYKGKKSVCIGNYECVNNIKISKEIINYAINEAKRKGAEFLIGPMNGSTWDNYRFSLKLDHPNFLLEPYHHIYYNDHFLNSGFMPISKYRSSINHVMPVDSEDVLKLEDKFYDSGVNIRNIEIRNYENELKKLYPFISSAFQSNFLYTPISWETFSSKYKEVAKIINPEYFLIAEDLARNIIGFIFCYDDQFNQIEKSLVIKTLARNASKQWSGLGHVLINKVIRSIKSKNYESVVHAFMIEDGTSTGASNKFLGKEYKNYILYGLQL